MKFNENKESRGISVNSKATVCKINSKVDGLSRRFTAPRIALKNKEKTAVRNN